jgi:RNA polymerase sigma-70 factor (ECF subfamily)
MWAEWNARPARPLWVRVARTAGVASARMHSEESSFARVYDEHVWRVYGFFAYRLGRRDSAEDLTQATFERALRAWSRFDSRRASESTWLLAIARNLLIDHYRRDRSSLTEPINEELAPVVPGPEEHLTTSPELLSALTSLTERDREVLALRFGGDMSGPEIAKLLNLSLANVQQILSRSLRKLRGLLEETGYDRPRAASAISRPPAPR